jgi:hypothetical protein
MHRLILITGLGVGLAFGLIALAPTPRQAPLDQFAAFPPGR